METTQNFANNSWILHHDNAPADVALSVKEFLAIKQITVLEHPAYSPDLAPIDFFLFPKIKEILKARHFDESDDIRSNTTSWRTLLSDHVYLMTGSHSEIRSFWGHTHIG